MKKVTAIGGVFFKTQEVKATREWYARHLGIESGPYGAHFSWLDPEAPGDGKHFTAWNPFSKETTYFDPGKQEFMMNYRVADLEALLEELQREGVKQVGDIEFYPYGKFAWILDCDGRKVELWEPVDRELGLE